MSTPIRDDETTHPDLRSWVPGADETEFPIQNLPLGVFAPRDGGPPRVGVAIGDQVLDLARLAADGLLPDPGQVFAAPTLNPFLALGPDRWRETRRRVSSLLQVDGPGDLRDDASRRQAALRPADQVEMRLPFVPGDYVDFYASETHATNLGRMFRPDSAPLLPNWKHLPVGYHGRSATVVASGTPIQRPNGQRKPKDATQPTFGPSGRLDVEVEVGFVTGPGKPLGEPIRTDEVGQHVFGLVLVNDWSARDIQAWEYVPLGPFLGKSFATTVSPWVVPLDALQPFRVPGPPQDDPKVLPYLQVDGPWGIDLHLELALETPEMRAAGEAPAVVSRPRFREMYWSIPQQLAHATVNGATIRPGDLFASGTVSNEEPATRGSLIELSWNGTDPVTLPGGARRSFLEDGDTAIIRGRCGGGDTGRPAIGFGECRGTVSPAKT
ncbi:MAG TPA: fumarylacetoacetase [Polyangiaceae bacterium LLY-WYZ-14_1]|nr:fumarylacetoacetase [Polyangiaceae bacterium LLY-WYZ-14_1]